jgi:hypothetical protein
MLIAGAANQIASSNIKSGKGTSPVIEILQSICNYNIGDRVLSQEIELISEKILNNDFINEIIKNNKLE